MEIDSAQSQAVSGWHRLRLPERLALIAALLVVEKFLVSSVIDYESVHGALAMRLGQPLIFRFALALVATLALFVAARDGALWRERLFPGPDAPLRRRWLAVHGLLVALLLPVAHSVYQDGPQPLPFAAMVALAATLTGSAVIAALGAVAPLASWRRIARGLGGLWLYAGSAALVSTAAIHWSESLWPIAARSTFFGVQVLLQPLLPSLQSDWQHQALATDKFAISVAPACSGLEGAGLMLAFCAAWLLYFRSEYRFPRALLLIPAGIALSLALNVVRIAALMLIGHSGHPAVAVYGFHSQAGWMAFTGAAMALAYFSRRSAWLSQSAGAKLLTAGNPVASYLMPFLAILAAGMVAHAASSGFEYLYPLRLVACVTALWIYRRPLLAMDWHCSWRGAAAGAAVFVVWLLFARATLSPSGMPAALAQLAPVPALGWIALRAMAAVVTVPLAEELAYRGFLQRRWQRADFESLDFKAVRWPALALTSAVFGLAHGAMWPAGVIAGLVYGALAMRTGRLGESVLAHATTNALLAGLVLFAGQWQYW